MRATASSSCRTRAAICCARSLSPNPGTTGTVTTLAGQAGSIGVKLGALPGSLGSASGLALIDDTNNVLLVGESLENAVLQITAGP